LVHYWLHRMRGYSQGEPPLICSGAKAASTIPVAEIFARTLGGYFARKPSTTNSAPKGAL
jgi:hypothetical protein